MKYAVIRLTTDANNVISQALVSSYDGTPEGRQRAEADFHTQLADAVTKVRTSGRLADGAYLLTNEGQILEQKFYVPIVETIVEEIVEE